MEHDFNIANQTFPLIRGDINNALLALVSKNSKATEPSTTYAFMWWLDTANSLLKIRNEADSAWIVVGELGAGGFMPWRLGEALGTGAIVGEIRMWAGSSAPAGWLLCDGSAVGRVTYGALYAVIGENYGAGDGSSTFNLPDFRGRSPLGVGQGDTAEGGGAGTDRSLADVGGAEEHTLSEAEMPSHDHSEAAPAGTQAVGGGTLGPANVGSSGATTGSAGGDDAHNNMHPFLAVNFIVFANV